MQPREYTQVIAPKRMHPRESIQVNAVNLMQPSEFHQVNATVWMLVCKSKWTNPNQCNQINWQELMQTS